MESFDFIVISREFSDTFFMLGFIFLNKSGFFIFSCVFSFFQGLIKESSLLVNPFKVFSHLKFGMIDNSLSLISGLCEGSSLEVFPSDVVDRWFSVLVFNVQAGYLLFYHLTDVIRWPFYDKNLRRFIFISI